MTPDNKKELFELVIKSVADYGLTKTMDTIYGFHMGLPGMVKAHTFDTGNSYLLRRYRNTVSANPAHLIDAAGLKKYRLKEEKKNRSFDTRK